MYRLVHPDLPHTLEEPFTVFTEAQVEHWQTRGWELLDHDEDTDPPAPPAPAGDESSPATGGTDDPPGSVDPDADNAGDNPEGVTHVP